jgi:hypothetical protein
METSGFIEGFREKCPTFEKHRNSNGLSIALPPPMARAVELSVVPEAPHV